jgi:hypothetical protein
MAATLRYSWRNRMTDGNAQAIAQYLDEREEWDALQEVTVELEQAEARIEELEAKLAKVIDFVAEVGGGFKFGESLVDWANLHVLKARTLLAELKGETDE